jgi:ABC-type Mn2+/Zn2+ transport system ATPase subunit
LPSRSNASGKENIFMVENDSASKMHVDAPMLEWHDLTVAYGRRPVLWNVDFEIPKPCSFGIIGPNGAGKSTLLKASLDLVQRAGGYVRFWGQPLLKLVRELRMCHKEKQLTGIFQ